MNGRELTEVATKWYKTARRVKGNKLQKEIKICLTKVLLSHLPLSPALKKFYQSKKPGPALESNSFPASFPISTISSKA
jgi:hypothetical protein